MVHRIVVDINCPNTLLREIRTAIDTQKVRTWGYDASGHFCHTVRSWDKVAWLRPSLEEPGLVFRLFVGPGKRLPPDLRAMYIKRFVSMLVIHFSYLEKHISVL